MLLLSEVIGQLLWSTANPWLEFVGAMVAVSCGFVGIALTAVQVIRRFGGSPAV